MNSHRDDEWASRTAEEVIIDALRAQFTPLVASLLTPETEPALVYTPAPVSEDAHP